MVPGNLLNPDGRIPRSIFWARTVVISLVVFVVQILLLGLRELIGQSTVFEVIVTIVFLPLSYILIMVQAKRWHDLNKSAWFVLINFIPFVGGLICLIILGVVKGTKGPNRYGPDPLEMPRKRAFED